MTDDQNEITRPLAMLNPWQGVHVAIYNDTTDEIDVEGARMSAKTTLLLDKELAALRKYPGIRSLLFRYSDKATQTKLIPAFEEICRARHFSDYAWDSKELAFVLSNGSKAYMFGLKAANQVARYEKLRGTDVSRVYNDQSEELPADIGQELRASLRQKGYPHQLTFSPNPIATNHWLADERHGGFPVDNSVKGRAYYKLSIYDNAYNLLPEDIERMERTYQPDHAKHGAMLLGTRGMNVVGDPVFEDTFTRSLHVRAIPYDADNLLLEAFDFGKYNPIYLAAQRPYDGGLVFLGGLIGEKLFLEDFIPTVKAQRAKWFGDLTREKIRTCCPTPGSLLTVGNRFTSLALLRSAGFMPIYREDSNAADVQLALIERLASYMRRRTSRGEESFGINSDPSRWVKASRQGLEPWPFFAQACEAGAVWDEHFRSVNNNVVRQVKTDDWFANALRCAQNIELNFCASIPTQAERDTARPRRDNNSGGNNSGSSSWMGI